MLMLLSGIFFTLPPMSHPSPSCVATPLILALPDLKL
jgi:hypothetical protein